MVWGQVLKYQHDSEYLDLEIDQVVLGESEIIVTAKTGGSVLKEVITDGIEGYYSIAYIVECVELLSVGMLQSEPYAPRGRQAV